jgi:putative hydrolase of the HAD superfamily
MSATGLPGAIPPSPGIEGVFFDLYGTLILFGDLERAWMGWLAVLQEKLEETGFAVNAEELARRCDGFLSQPEPPLLDEGQTPYLTLYERRLQRLCRQLGATGTGPDDWRRLAETTASRWQAEMRLDPEAIPVLDRLRSKKRLALVSNFDHPPHVHRLVADLELEPYFETVVVSGDVGCKKPDPAIFNPALAKTGLKPEQVAYVGDTDDDIGAAVAAGMLPVLVHRPRAADKPIILDYRQGDKEDEGVKGHGTMRTVTGLAQVADMFGQEE